MAPIDDLLHGLGMSGWCLAPNIGSLIPMRSPLSKKIPDELAKIQAEHPGQQVVAFFQDECRFGQQGTLIRVWAKRGSRPTAVRQTEYLWVVGAASPQTGQAEAVLAS